MKNPTTKKLLRAGVTLTMIALPQQGYTANQQDNPVQIQLLGNFFADSTEFSAAATDFLRRINVMHPFNPWQILR